MSIKEFDIVVVKKPPGFSTKDRKGWRGLVLQMWGEDKDGKSYPYLAVKDELGVSWPLNESDVTVVDRLNLGVK